jgi:hypothetical protein
MPEFILEVRDFRAFEKLDAFTQGYIEALFFTSEDQLDGDWPFNDRRCGVDDLAPETLARIKRDCERFQCENSAALELAYDEADDYGETEAGRDFWYTRCGHGAGFWDGDIPDHLGTALTDAAHAFGNLDAYLGDDGKVYLA